MPPHTLPDPPQEAAPLAVQGPEDGTRVLHRSLEILRTLLTAVALAVVIRVGIAQAYEVDGPSMEPTLITGERLIVARCAYGLTLPGLDQLLLQWAQPEVGDVVILASPRNPEEDLVKRVVGLPGDIIEVRDDQVLRNGEPLLLGGPDRCEPGRFVHSYPQCQTYREGQGGESWRITHSYLNWNQTLPPVAVPEGHIYVLGDHRTRSNDSRAFGPVPTSLLRGQVLFVD